MFGMVGLIAASKACQCSIMHSNMQHNQTVMSMKDMLDICGLKLQAAGSVPLAALRKVVVDIYAESALQ